MARLTTRYLNKKATLQLLTDESPWRGTVRKIFREAGELYYAIETEDGDSIHVSVASVSWIQPEKPKQTAKVIRLKAKLRLVR